MKTLKTYEYDDELCSCLRFVDLKLSIVVLIHCVKL